MPSNEKVYQGYAKVDEEAVRVMLLVPGIKKERIDITYKSHLLTVSVEEEKIEEGRGENACDFSDILSRVSGNFALRVGCDIDVEKSESRLEDGCLYITLPKAESEKPKKIGLS